MIKNILVAYDGSDHAERAVDVAAKLAAKFGSTIHLVHVIAHAHAGRHTTKFAKSEEVANPDELELQTDWAETLKPVQAKLAESGIREVRPAVLRGDPTHELLRHEKKISADMIVMGRRGLSPVAGLLIGSVSAKINALANCTVVTVK